MDPILLLLITLIIAVGAAYFFLAGGTQSATPTADSGNLLDKDNAGWLDGEPNENDPTGRRGRGGRQNQQQQQRRNGMRRQEDASSSDDDDSSDEEELDENGNRIPRGPLRVQGGGTKAAQRKARRQQEREERRQMREGMDNDRRKKKEEELEKEEEAKAEEERRKIMEERTLMELREEARKQKEDEYQEWVGSIEVEAEGEQGPDEDSEKALLESLKDEILVQKYVVLQDLARDLGSKTNSGTLSVERVVEGIEHLIATNQLSGVFDDRGKFVAISEAEYKQMSRFISQRGRVSMEELVRECNRVVSSSTDGQ